MVLYLLNFILFFSLKMITSDNPRETPKNIFNTFSFTRIVRYSLELDYVVFSDIVLFVMTNKIQTCIKKQVKIIK